MQEARLLSLAERQQQFARALLSSEPVLPSGLACPRGAVGAERFAIYRNNVAVSLIEALRSAYPVVNRLVGDEFFSAMARAHSLLHLPSSPVLLAYGGDFPDFIGAFEQAATLPYLAEVARLEWFWLESYHAAEAEPLVIEALHTMAPFELPELRLNLHPSARLIHLVHPALAIWRAHQEPDDPGEMEFAEGPEHLLCVRPYADVEIVPLSHGAHAFLETVRARATIGEAVEAALNAEPDIAIADLFPTLFGAGVFAGFADEDPLMRSVEQPE